MMPAPARQTDKTDKRAGLRVLIVDDEPVNRLVLSRMLSARGHGVIEAASGQAAIELASDHRPGLILMDINMPGMTGVEAAQRILETLGNAAPPIVAVTANDTSAQRLECEAAGFLGFIGKPLRMPLLLECLDAAVRL